jgi:hypothetical protein
MSIVVEVVFKRLTSGINQPDERALFFVGEKAEAHAEAYVRLNEGDFASQGEPFAIRQLDFKADEFAFRDGPARVYETAAEADVADARIVAAGETFPFGFQAQRDALIASTLIIHGVPSPVRRPLFYAQALRQTPGLEATH